MEEQKMFCGYMKLAGNDGDKKIFFSEEEETEMIENGFCYFSTEDHKGNKGYLLANPNEGHIRFIEYWEEK